MNVTITKLKEEKENQLNFVKNLNEKLNENKKLKLLLNYALGENLSFIHKNKNEIIKVDTNNNEMIISYSNINIISKELFILHIANNELSKTKDELFIDFDYMDPNCNYENEDIIAILERISY